MLLAFTLSATTVLSAAADPMCLPRSEMDALLAGYGEAEAVRPVMVGEDAHTVFVNRDTGTWSALITDPDGLSCMQAVGTDWRGTAQ